MAASLPHLSTDQVAAFVELSRQGQIRGAAKILGITEQGLRNRLITLEGRLGAQLYRKRRGPHRSTILTESGRHFLPRALAFLERAHELCRTFEAEQGQPEPTAPPSHYPIRYFLLD